MLLSEREVIWYSSVTLDFDRTILIGPLTADAIRAGRASSLMTYPQPTACAEETADVVHWQVKTVFFKHIAKQVSRSGKAIVGL